jgi:YjbE family integral membrane protein
MTWSFILAALGIALLDIVLSGDNALVIAAAASRLPRARRLIAIVWGGVFAIVFRIALTAAATEILQVKLLQAIGGVLLIGIAIRVLPKGDGDGRPARSASERFFTAVVTILIADATMSLDNILAVGALAHGNIQLLASGLLFSMLVLFVASAVIARLMEALPWLLDLAAVVIAYTAANLFVSDPIAGEYFHFSPVTADSIHAGAVALVLVVDVFLRVRARRRARRELAKAPTTAAAAVVNEALNGHAPQEANRALSKAGQEVIEGRGSALTEPDRGAASPR